MLSPKVVAVYQELLSFPFLTLHKHILNREYRNKLGLINHKRMEEEAALLKS